MIHGHRVVAVGGGFGGLLATRGLRRTPVDVTLIDRQSSHLFQPLAYSPGFAGLIGACQPLAPCTLTLRLYTRSPHVA